MNLEERNVEVRILEREGDHYKLVIKQGRKVSTDVDAAALTAAIKEAFELSAPRYDLYVKMTGNDTLINLLNLPTLEALMLVPVKSIFEA